MFRYCCGPHMGLFQTRQLGFRDNKSFTEHVFRVFFESLRLATRFRGALSHRFSLFSGHYMPQTPYGWRLRRLKVWKTMNFYDFQDFL